MPPENSPIQSSTEEKTYQDVSPSASDEDSGLEDDSVDRHARTSDEVADYDRELLGEEDEREKLLAAENTRVFPGSLGKGRKHEPSYRSGDQRSKRKARKSQYTRGKPRIGSHDEEGKLMYEMEEGGPKSETSSQASSSSAELNKMDPAHSSMSKVRNRPITIYGPS